MRRSWSAAERALLIIGVMLTAPWCALAFVVVSAYRGGSTTSTWVARLVMAFLVGIVTAAVIMLGRYKWLRVIARPFPQRGLNGWMARQSGWALALCCLVVFGGADVSAILVVSHAERRGLPAPLVVQLLATSAVSAAVIALMMRVIWRRQAENGKAQTRIGD